MDDEKRMPAANKSDAATEVTATEARPTPLRANAALPSVRSSTTTASARATPTAATVTTTASPVRDVAALTPAGVRGKQDQQQQQQQQQQRPQPEQRAAGPQMPQPHHPQPLESRRFGKDTAKQPSTAVARTREEHPGQERQSAIGTKHPATLAVSSAGPTTAPALPPQGQPISKNNRSHGSHDDQVQTKDSKEESR